jgi:deazaflavin-dependent oxidoreductase (nitroreductase family)
MTEIPDAETMKAFNKNIVDEFRANGGKVGGPFEGATLLLLTTTGAKSGQPRLAPLAYLTIDGKMIIIGSKAGAETNPDWVHNLRANPHAHIEVGIDAYDVTAASCRPRSATRRTRRWSPRLRVSVSTRPRPAASSRSSSCSAVSPGLRLHSGS